MFKRKVYDALTEWKEKYSGNYAAMLEGARRVGKSTVAENLPGTISVLISKSILLMSSKRFWKFLMI